MTRNIQDYATDQWYPISGWAAVQSIIRETFPELLNIPAGEYTFFYGKMYENYE